MSLENALHVLRTQNYNSFILTIGCSTVAIYYNGGKFKIFDSHARDSFGMTDSRGTCVLLEFSQINRMTEYLQVLYNNRSVLFELKGVHIGETEINEPTSNDINPQQTAQVNSCLTNSGNNYCDVGSAAVCDLKLCSAISF